MDPDDSGKRLGNETLSVTRHKQEAIAISNTAKWRREREACKSLCPQYPQGNHRPLAARLLVLWAHN